MPQPTFQRVVTPEAPPRTGMPADLRRILFVLVSAIAINYIDRGSLSIAAPLLTEELGLSSQQLGILLSSFFWTYSVFQLVSGWLVDRFHVSWVLGIGFIAWSLATAVTGIVDGFLALLLMRLVLGAGESVMHPSFSKILAQRFAEHQRGLANALIDSGTKLGPALGMLFGGLLMARFGWRPFFVVVGFGSLLWLLPWSNWLPPGEQHSRSKPEPPPRVSEILKRRAAWATFTGHFCGNYFFYFLLTWLPFYLIRERGFSMDAMATIGALAYMVTAGSSMITGWISDRLIAGGATPTRVRKTCTGAGLGGATVVLAVAAVPDPTAAMIFLMLASISFGLFASSFWAITQTIAGPSAAGRWTGLQNFFANLAGVIAPALTGYVVQETGQFFIAFAVSAFVVLFGAAVYLFWLGPVEAIKWNQPSTA